MIKNDFQCDKDTHVCPYVIVVHESVLSFPAVSIMSCSSDFNFLCDGR